MASIAILNVSDVSAFGGKWVVAETAIQSDNVNQASSSNEGSAYDYIEKQDIVDGGANEFDLDFMELTPSPNEDPNELPNPHKLKQTLVDQKLIFLDGDLHDPRGLGKRLALELAADETYPDINRAVASLRPIKELGFLEATQEPTVFVLSHVDPVDLSVPSLYRRLGDHYAIIIPNRPKVFWRLPDRLESCWEDRKDRDFYTKGQLKSALKRGLSDDGLERAYKDPAAREAKIDKIASTLGSLNLVKTFISDFNREAAAGRTPDVDGLLKSINDDSWRIGDWFHQQLNDRERTAALGLALFHDYDESRAFVALEDLMKGAWGERQDASRFIDYGDVAALTRFIAVGDSTEETGVIQCKGKDTQFRILEAAWSTHRRQIMAAMSPLVSASLLSIRTNASLLTGGGVFPEVVARLLGQIGRISLRAIEPELLRLIAAKDLSPSQTEAAHAVAGAALRQLLEQGGDIDRIIGLLQRWRRSAGVLVAITSLRGGKTDSFEQSNALLGQAIVTILSELASAYPPDQISDQVHQEILKYAKSRDAVRHRFCGQAMATIVKRHPKTMIAALDDLNREVGSERNISFRFALHFGDGLGHAIAGGDGELLTTVRDWIANGEHDAGQGFDQQKVRPRDKRLAIAALACGQAASLKRWDGDSGEEHALGHSEAGPLLNSILKYERHPLVRHAVRIAVLFLLKSNFKAMKPHFEHTVALLSASERDELTKLLVRLHCDQRTRQSGGDGMFYVIWEGQGYSCPVWLDKDPPRTPVLDTLFLWQEKDTDSEVSAFAARTIMEIRRHVERGEESKRTEIEKAQKDQKLREAEIAKSKAPEIASTQVSLGFLDRTVVVPLATLQKQHLQRRVAGNLHFLLSAVKTEREEFIDRINRQADQLEEEGNQSGADEIRAMLTALRRAYSLARSKGLIISGLVGLVLVAIVLNAL